MNDKNEILVDDLFFFVFGITMDANDNDKVRNCVHKAYLDLCRTIDYKFPSSEIERMKKKNSPQEDKYKAEAFEELKIDFIYNIEKMIIESLNEKEMLYDFDGWHENLSNAIKDNSKRKNVLIDKKDGEGLSYGQIQKWINMTIKYMRIMGLTDPCIDKYLHIPLDDYILKAASYKEKEKIFDKFNVYGLGIDNTVVKWSEISEYEKYIDYQNKVRNKTDCPIEWESKAWIAEATKRNKTEG